MLENAVWVGLSRDGRTDRSAKGCEDRLDVSCVGQTWRTRGRRIQQWTNDDDVDDDGINIKCNAGHLIFYIYQSNLKTIDRSHITTSLMYVRCRVNTDVCIMYIG